MSADRPRPRRSCAAPESGSALLLMPAGVLIVVVMGALMVDSAAAFLAEREAEATAAGLANDLATVALDERFLRLTGVYRIAERRVKAAESTLARLADEQLSAVFVPGTTNVAVAVAGPTEVRVTVSGRARRIIGPFGWTSLSPTYGVEASATARVALSG
ncbi:MAG TPA: hypothetical protein DEP66_01685 [Acidimicrobiaceae bacterium]|nr:hypothetical protein [Acidimicrobiaceae bacterium]HCB36950.1 hypothetical protein [Acidimicrobiaceae bacterium]